MPSAIAEAPTQTPVSTRTSSPTPKPVHVFRLNHGCYVAPMEGWDRPKDKDGNPLLREPETGNPILHPDHVYRYNEEGNNIIRSTIELDKRFPNDPSDNFGPKFTRVSGDPSLVDDRAAAANMALITDNEKLKQSNDEKDAKIREMQEMLLKAGCVSTTPGLEGMTLAQLDELAKTENIDLSGCRTKADKIAAIELARAT